MRAVLPVADVDARLRRAAAHHEAGHAMAMHALHIDFDGVSVHHDGTGEVHGTWRIDLTHPRHLMTQMIVDLAGPAGELFFSRPLGRNPHCLDPPPTYAGAASRSDPSSDLAKATRNAAAVSRLTGQSASVLLHRAWAAAVAMLTRPHRTATAHRSLAARLCEVDRLGAAEATDVMGDVWSPGVVRTITHAVWVRTL